MDVLDESNESRHAPTDNKRASIAMRLVTKGGEFLKAGEPQRALAAHRHARDTLGEWRGVALHSYGAARLERRSPCFVWRVMHTLMTSAAIAVGLALWVAATRRLRKLYLAFRVEARGRRLDGQAANDNDQMAVCMSNSSSS